MKDVVRKHWKKAVLVGAGAAATYYGGPVAGAKVQELLPVLWMALTGTPQ